MGESLEGKSKMEIDFDVLFSKLIEYVPNQEELDSGYTFTEETPVVQTFNLKEWSDFQGIDGMSDILDDGISFNIKTADNKAMFRFTLDTSVKPETGLSANNMKIDLEVEDFPWSRNDTFLALVSSIQSEKKIKTAARRGRKPKGVVDQDINAIVADYAQKGRKGNLAMAIPFGQLAGDNSSPFGEVMYVEQAEVTTLESRNRFLKETDNNSMETSDTAQSNDNYEMVAKDIFVVASSPPTVNAAEKREQIAFSFINSNNAQKVFWDPEVGVGYQSSAMSTLSASFDKHMTWFGFTVLVGFLGNLFL